MGWFFLLHFLLYSKDLNPIHKDELTEIVIMYTGVQCDPGVRVLGSESFKRS